MFFWCATWVYLKSLDGSPTSDCWTQIPRQVMQRHSDTFDSSASASLKNPF